MGFKIHNLHFKSPDPEKTAQWYVDNLGAEITSVREVAGTVGYRLDLDGVPLNVTGLVQGQALEQHYGLEHVGLFTDDLPGAIERIRASGARILEELLTPSGQKCCFLEGPEGVRIEITEMAE